MRNVAILIIMQKKMDVKSTESFIFHHNVKLRSENEWNADKNYNGK